MEKPGGPVFPRAFPCSLTISVHLVDHVLQLRLRRVLAQRPHDRAELFGGDCAVTVLVE